MGWTVRGAEEAEAESEAEEAAAATKTDKLSGENPKSLHSQAKLGVGLAWPAHVDSRE